MVVDDSFFEEFSRRGCVLVEGALDTGLLDRIRPALEKANATEAAYHGTTDYADYGMVQCCAMYDRLFIDLLAREDLMQPFHAVLGEGCIVYAYASSSLPPGAGNFASRIHVDCPRLIPGYPTNMAVVFLVDDFTEENGATWYLPGSHTSAERPSRKEFFAKAERLVGPAGSAWYLNPRMWHAAGKNESGKWRHSFGLNMCRPFMKQRFDLPRLLSEIDLDSVPESALQKLGFHAQPPTSLDEYYRPLHQRTFRQPYE